MAIYLKIEEPVVDSNTSLQNDLMGLSLLALLLSPWAALGLVVSMLEYSTIPNQASFICVSVLVIATPKLLQLLIPHRKPLQQKKT